MEETTTFCIKGFPKSLYTRYKAYCALKGTTIKAGLESLIVEALEARERTQEKEKGGVDNG